MVYAHDSFKRFEWSESGTNVILVSENTLLPGQN